MDYIKIITAETFLGLQNIDYSPHYSTIVQSK